MLRIFKGIGSKLPPITPSFLANETLLHSRRDPSSAFIFYLMARIAHLTHRDPQTIEKTLARYGFRSEDTRLFSSPETGINVLTTSAPREVIISFSCANKKFNLTMGPADHSKGFFGANGVPIPHNGMREALQAFDKKHGLFEHIASIHNPQKRCWYTGFSYGAGLSAQLMNRQPEKTNCFLAAFSPLTFGNPEFIRLFNRKFEDNIYVVRTPSSPPSLGETPYFESHEFEHEFERVQAYADSIGETIAKDLLRIEKPNGLYTKATPEAQERAMQKYKAYVEGIVDGIIREQTKIEVDTFNYCEKIIPEPQDFYNEHEPVSVGLRR